MRIFLYLASTVVLLSACGKLTEDTEVKFAMKSFSMQSSPGCTEDSVGCSTFQVDYPEFTELDSSVQASIMRKIGYLLGGEAAGEVKSITVLGNDFITDFNAFVKDVPDYEMGWYFKANVSVLIASDTLISLQVDSESFTGGAHGSYSTNFVNVEPKTGTSYLLGALLRPGYEDALNRLGEEDFRRQRTLDENDSLEALGFNFAAGAFRLNENYGFRKEGIVFFFNSYEIASYAEGPTEILIPYERLREWMIR